MRRGAAAAAVLVMLLSSCGTPVAGQVPYVDLSERAPVPAYGEGGDVAPLRIAIGAVLSPAGNIESYTAFADYVSERLGRPVEIVQRRTYQETNDLLASGAVDIGFVCTSAYVRGRDEFGLRLLAAPQVDGGTVYYSKLIVGVDNPARNMSDLRGATFAFTDPMSTTGRVYPTFLVGLLGDTPGSFFETTFFTHSHERAIESVAAGVADAAGVDSLVLDHVLALRPDLEVKVIASSPPYMIPPVVASPSLSPRWASQVQGLLLSLGDDPAAAPVLAALGVDGFVRVDDSAYDGVRDLIARVDLGS